MANVYQITEYGSFVSDRDVPGCKSLPAKTFEQLKESGAIEYSSDIVLALQLKGAGEKNFDPTEAKRKNPRQIELVVLKNRDAAVGDKVSFDYYPMFNLFDEAGVS